MEKRGRGRPKKIKVGEEEHGHGVKRKASLSENNCQDKTTPFSLRIECPQVPSKNVPDLTRYTSNLIAQTQDPESIQIAPPYSTDLTLNSHLPESETNETLNENVHQEPLTINPSVQMCLINDKSYDNDEIRSQPENAPVDVLLYNVSNEMMPLLKAIFSRYGDISKDSSFSMDSRSLLLELVCCIYKRLDASSLMSLTDLELQAISAQIADLELVKVEVGWLRSRLDQISRAKEICKGVSSVDDVQARTVSAINEKKNAVGSVEKELELCMASMKKLEERLEQGRGELAAVLTVAEQIHLFQEKSFVHGLL